MKTKYFLQLGTLLLVLTACGNNHDVLPPEETKVFENARSGVEVFKETVHSFTTQKCAGCHGNKIGPQFAVADVASAYEVSKTFIDFINPSQSRFIERSKDGHCGSACATDGSEITEMIQQWVEAETQSAPTESGPPPPRVVTAAQSLPATLPTGATFATISWPLEGLNPALGKAVFSIEIQQFDMDSYQLRNPKLKAGAVNLYVKDIRILFNDNYDPANSTYTVVAANVSKNATVTLSNRSLVALMDQGGANDKISVSFGVLGVK